MAGRDEYDDEEILSKQQRYKAALHFNIGTLCEDVGKREDLEFSREVIAVINEAVYNHIETIACDLESFATHAKRKVITAEDVKLCCRRNPDLLKLVMEWSDELKSKKEVAGEKKGSKGKGKKAKKIILDSDSDMEDT
jgi:centromere protein S